MHWEQLPSRVREAIEKRVGGHVSEATTQPGGFSPGLAARLRTADGRQVFVKAVSEDANPDTPGIHRREAEVVAALPREAAVPRLLWSYDEGGWVALGFEDIEGRLPAQPWRDDELKLVIDGLVLLHELLTPSPVESETASHAFAKLVKGWGEIRESGAVIDDWSARNLDRVVELEAEAPNMVAGSTLLNFDVRADNIIIARDRVFFVDWPWARIGAPFVEWVGLAIPVHMQGGPKPEDFIRRVPMGGVGDQAINAVLAAFTGYFLSHSRRPAPPGLPTLRAFQAAQGKIALAWLRERTGW